MDDDILEFGGVSPPGKKAKKPPRSGSEWKKLAKLVGKRTSKPATNVRWVYDNIDADPSEIDPKEVPSSGALAHLRWAQENYADFMAQWQKTIPNSSKLEMEERFTDDGRKSLDTLAALHASLTSAQEDRGQPGLPAGDHQSGHQQQAS